MSRMSERLSLAWSAVRCPGCGQVVRPHTDPAPDSAETTQPRWSLLWSPPRGDFCPECEFPLSRYFGRLKWIRLFVVGVGIVIVAFTAQWIGVMLYLSATYVNVMKVILLLGGAVALVGGLGVVLGGKRTRPVAAAASPGPPVTREQSAPRVTEARRRV